MKKIFILVFFACVWAGEVMGQISLVGTATYDGTFTVGDYSVTSQGITFTLSPSTFDAGTTYYHGNNMLSYDTYGTPFVTTVFIVRQLNKWVMQYDKKTVYSSTGAYTKIYHTETTFSGNNPPCNTWWIRDADNDKIAIQISGTTCDNTTCVPAAALAVSKIGSECVTQTITLNASTCSGTFRWNNGATTAIISPSTNNTYFVSCDDGGACPSLLGSGIINYPATLMNPSISSNAAAIVEPNTAVTFSAATSCPSPSILQWDDNSTATTRIVSPATTTVYTAKCVNGTCESNKTTLVVTVNATSTSCVEHWERIDYSTPVKSGSNLYFIKNNIEQGYELWKADLNMNNASMVKNINAKRKNFQPNNAITMNGIRYFIATDNISEAINGYSSYDLWRTDGTTNGTYKVKDVNPETSGINPTSLITVGNLLYFNAYDGVSDGLWRSDGTAAGTYKISNEMTISTSYFYSNNILYFISNNNSKLGKTDGTVVGTVILNSNLSGNGFTELNGIIYFVGYTNSTGGELWKTDGTVAGTTIVKDIYPGPNGNPPTAPLVFNGKLIFSESNNISGTEPWISDGTTAGTVLLKDTWAGANGSAGSFTILNGFAYFSADDGINGLELWRTDGTATGTYLFKDLVAGAVGSSPQTTSFVTIGTKTYFTSINNSTVVWSLWETDGTSAGTILKFNIGTATGGKYANIYKIDNNLYCNYNNYSYRVNPAMNGLIGMGSGIMINPIVFNGYIYYTPQNINSLITQIKRVSLTTNTDEAFFGTGSGTSYGNQFVYDGALHFIETANNGNNQSNTLWKSNGTIAGSAPYFSNGNVKDGDAFGSFTYKDVNGVLYFIANDGTDVSQYPTAQLWKTDGTEAGTIKLTSLTGTYGFTLMEIGANLGNTLFFNVVNNTTYTNNLWKSDGTVAGTVLFKSNVKYFQGTFDSFVHNGNMYFNAFDATNGTELWKTDGTVAGTVLVKDINIGTGDSYIMVPKSVGNNFFFYAYDGVNYGLWRSDGTTAGTILLKTGTISSNDFPTVVLNNTLYFSFQTTDKGSGLWKSDGTVAGTELVSAVGLSNLFVFNNKIFFTSADNTFGSELWVSDGTRFGTKLFKDINIGSASSVAKALTVRGGYLYISTSNMLNLNLFKSDGTPEGTFPVPYQTDFEGFEVEGVVYRFSPTCGNCGIPQNYKLSLNPKIAPNIISAYDIVYPNTTVTLYNTNSTSELVWNYRNTTVVNGNNNSQYRQIIDTPPTTTVYTAVLRDKLCQSAPTTKTITITTIICPSASTSIGSGDWSVTSTWQCGDIPTLTKQVEIQSGHIVTISGNVHAKSVKLLGTGKLNYTGTAGKLFLNQ